MRQAFAHEAVLSMGPDEDIRAPGAAVTVALCGHWKHDLPCPLAPHHSNATRAGGEVRVRVLFAAEPEAESDVRHRIDAAFASGELCGPDGVTARWQLESSQRSAVASEEADHTQRLLGR
jgi:hypothetical protein